MVCSTIAVEIATPRAPPPRNDVHGRWPKRASSVPATSPIPAATGSAGISLTQFARAIEKATANWATASSAKLIQSSQKFQALTLLGSALGEELPQAAGAKTRRPVGAVAERAHA